MVPDPLINSMRCVCAYVWWLGGLLNYEMPGIEKALGILNNPW